MKKFISLAFLALLLAAPSYGQSSNGQIKTNHTLIFSNTSLHYTKSATIFYFEKQLWTVADLDINELEGKKLEIVKYKVQNRFGEMVADDSPYATLLYGMDGGDFYSVYSGSVDKNGDFYYCHNNAYDTKSHFSYTVVLQPKTVVYYNMDGDKEIEEEAAFDNKGRLTKLAWQTFRYDNNDRLTQIESHAMQYANYNLQWKWTEKCITSVYFEMNDVRKQEDIEILETFDNGKWKKVKVTLWEGDKKNPRDHIENIEILERQVVSKRLRGAVQQR